MCIRDRLTIGISEASAFGAGTGRFRISLIRILGIDVTAFAFECAFSWYQVIKRELMTARRAKRSSCQSAGAIISVSYTHLTLPTSDLV